MRPWRKSLISSSTVLTFMSVPRSFTTDKAILGKGLP